MHGSTAQKIMEVAANVDKDLRFVVTFYSSELGYAVDAIGNTYMLHLALLPNIGFLHWSRK